MNHLKVTTFQDLTQKYGIHPDNMIILPIACNTACVGELYFAPQSRRWVDRTLWPFPDNLLFDKTVHMNSVLQLFTNLPEIEKFIDYRFYFIKYFQDARHPNVASILLVGMYDNHAKMFCGIPVLYEFKNGYRRHKLGVEPELTTTKDWPPNQAEEQLERFITNNKECERFIVITPKQLYYIGE